MSTVIVVVGASKGFGKALIRSSLQDTSITCPGHHTVFVLLTTSEENTRRMWNEIYENIRGIRFADDTSGSVQVLIEETDLADIHHWLKIEEVIRIMFSQFRFTIANFYVFMNAGSVKPVGDLLPPPAINSPRVVHTHARTPLFEFETATHCMLNFTSFVSLLRLLLRTVIFGTLDSSRVRIRVVNVSSLAALAQLPGMAIYGAIKAARDSLIKSLALEVRTKHPEIDAKFLSYAPGAMDTELVRNDLAHDRCPNNYVKDSDMVYVDPNVSADRCVSLLTGESERFQWENGDHVDYYDI